MVNLGVFYISILSIIHFVNSQWTIEKADLWYQKVGWRVGCNFIPSTAINQLEMWQADTFDILTIDRELGYAESIGFNTIRVFLHYIAWGEDRIGFENRIQKFLEVANKHNIKTLFVLFDDCWNVLPKAGLQPQPIPGVHNSGWMQCPGSSPESLYGGWDLYVTDVLQKFGTDDRILMWDLYNEPGNSGHENSTLPLLQNVFEWARNVNPSQPITSGKWTYADWSKDINIFLAENSDIITFHSYCDVDCFNGWVNDLQPYLRPIICTQYMARTAGSHFQTHLPVMKEKNVGAINWGLVFGKTQTVFPWGSPQGAPVPQTWFHDVFWSNSTPFSVQEVQFIKNITNSQTQLPIE